MARKKTTVDERGPEKAKIEKKAVRITFSSSEMCGEKQIVSWKPNIGLEINWYRTTDEGTKTSLPKDVER